MPREIARRSFLARMSVASAAMMAAGLPMPVLARPVPSAAHPDAALIAQAAAVTRLTRLLDGAYERLARKNDAVTLAQGPRPIKPAAPRGACVLAEHVVDPASDVERCFTATFRKPPADHREAERRHTEALAAWTAEGDRLAHQAGKGDAGTLCDALSERLADAVDALTGMPAASPTGMAAKAGAFLAVMEHLDGAALREIKFARSLARDAMRIGGRADV